VIEVSRSWRHSPDSGPLREHCNKMVGFLESEIPGALSPEQVQTARSVIVAVGEGRKVDAGWVDIASRTLLHRRAPPDQQWPRLIKEFGRGN
jgi:hypothetical protein